MHVTAGGESDRSLPSEDMSPSAFSDAGRGGEAVLVLVVVVGDGRAAGGTANASLFASDVCARHKCQQLFATGGRGGCCLSNARARALAHTQTHTNAHWRIIKAESCSFHTEDKPDGFFFCLVSFSSMLVFFFS